MRRLLTTSRQRGDTIVEVLIAVAIVSSVLAGAFTVSQKSALAVRDSQERGEMLQMLESQVELVRALALDQSDNTTGVFATSPAYFCINESTRTRIHFPAATTTLPLLQNDDFTTYDSQCTNLGIGNRYNIAIKYDAGTKVFTFVGRWDGIHGRKNQQQLSYRIFPGKAFVALTSPTPLPSTCDASQRKDIVLTLDRSSSMTTNWAAPNISRIASLKDSAKYFVDNIDLSPSGNQVSVVGFHNIATEYSSLTSNKSDLVDAVDSIGTQSGTNYLAGLDTSANELLGTYARPGANKVTIFISDGAPTSPGNTASNIYAKADELAGHGIKIYTIGIAPDLNGSVILQNMTRNGGSHHAANDPANLQSIIATLATENQCA